MGVVELVAAAFYLMILIMRYNAFPFDESALLCATVLFSAYFVAAGVGFRKKTFFLLALFRHDDEEKLLIVFRVLGGLLFAAVFWCVWFHEVYHPWREHISLLISVLLGMVLFFGLYLFEDRMPNFSKSLLVRGVPLSMLIVFYMTVAVETRIHWRYDDNYYRELLIYAIHHPDDPDAQIVAQRYYEQMQGLRPFPNLFQGVDDSH